MAVYLYLQQVHAGRPIAHLHALLYLAGVQRLGQHLPPLHIEDRDSGPLKISRELDVGLLDGRVGVNLYGEPPRQ